MPTKRRGERRIDAAMTVQQVNMAYPRCQAVFERHGLAGCGGPYGPQEPLSFFAQAHRIDLQELLQELEQATAERPSTAMPAPQPGVQPGSQPEAGSSAVFRLFLWSALGVTLSLGSLWGVYNLTRIALAGSLGGVSPAWSQAHGHAQLFGWMALFIMGVAYYVLPRFRNAPAVSQPWAKVTLWLMLGGVVMRATSQSWAIEGYAAGVMAMSGILEMTAIAMFTGAAVYVFANGRAPREGYEKFILAGLAWFVVLGVWNLWTVVVMARGGYSVMYGRLNDGLIVLAVLGFAANFIFGLSLRILPNFLGLRPSLRNLERAGFGAFNAGIVLSLVPASTTLAAATLLLVGAASVAAGLRIFEPPRVRVAIEGVDQAFSWFLVQGYVWLQVGLVILLAHAVAARLFGRVLPLEVVGAGRHALALGFITSMMLGVGYRVLPVFHGVTLYSPVLLRSSFWLLLVGNVLRVGGEIALPYAGGALATETRLALGLSGYLQFAALACFAVDLWQTLHRSTSPPVAQPVAQPGLTQVALPVIANSVGSMAPWSESVSPQPATEASRQQAISEAPENAEALHAGTRIAPLVERFPAVKNLLIDMGFDHLRHLPEIPPMVTLGIAAQRHGLDLAELMARIKEIVNADQEVQA